MREGSHFSWDVGGRRRGEILSLIRRDLRPRPRASGGRRRRRRLAVAIALLAVAWAGHGLVGAALPSGPEPSPEVKRCVLEPLDIDPLPCTSAILLEVETGTVLYAQNPDEIRGPASLVKMMLLLLVYEDLAAGRIHKTDLIPTSKNASTMGGSQVFLAQGEEKPLADLLDAVAIASANDAAMAIAEHLAGSEKAFVDRMNARAKQLGCHGTEFANVHGLDLRNQPRNFTTARDLATIGRQLVKHKDLLKVTSTKRKQFRNEDFILDNTNKLLGRFKGLDGLKTGWTPRAGGCFVATAERDGVRLIAVILASVPGRARFRVAEKLLAAGYAAHPKWRTMLEAGELLPDEERIPKEPGSDDTRIAAAGGTVQLLVEDERADRVSTRVRRASVAAKHAAKDRPALGWVDLRLDGRTVATVPARPSRKG